MTCKLAKISALAFFCNLVLEMIRSIFIEHAISSLKPRFSHKRKGLFVCECCNDAFSSFGALYAHTLEAVIIESIVDESTDEEEEQQVKKTVVDRWMKYNPVYLLEAKRTWLQENIPKWQTDLDDLGAHAFEDSAFQCLDLRSLRNVAIDLWTATSSLDPFWTNANKRRRA